MSNSGITAIGSTATGAQCSRWTPSRVLPAIFMFVLSVSFGAGQLRAQCGSLGAPSTTWQNGGNSFWSLDGNWTSGTPTASTNACILNGLSTVTLNTTGNANGLQLASGNNLNIKTGASLNLGLGPSLNSGTITNYGTFKDNINGAFDNEGAIINASGAKLTGGFNLGFNDTTGTIVNAGTFTAGSVFFNSFSTSPTFTNASGGHVSGVDFSGNGGMIINNSGGYMTNVGISLDFSQGVSNNGVFINTLGIDMIEFGGVGNGSSGHFTNLSTITLQDTGIDNAGILNNRGTITFFSAMTDGGSLTNSGILNNTGTIDGNANSECLADVCFMSNSGTINNRGTMNITGVSLFGFPYFTNTGTLNNSGSLNLDGTSIDNSGIFKNSGAVTIDSSTLFTTSTNYTQRGGSTLVDGTLTATGSALVDIKGGTLSGTGTINGDVLMKGILSPGSNGVPGAFTINGNYEQGGAGVFNELISGANSNGVLDVTGILALDPGSLLEITLQGGFNPLGDSFTILNYGSLVGEFSNGSQFFADGFEWTLSYGSNDAVLKAVSAAEPGTISLIGIGFLALLGYAAKKRAAL